LKSCGAELQDAVPLRLVMSMMRLCSSVDLTWIIVHLFVLNLDLRWYCLTLIRVIRVLLTHLELLWIYCHCNL
jgi:hypothetical protein